MFPEYMGIFGLLKWGNVLDCVSKGRDKKWVRDLGLLKDLDEILGSRLCEKYARPRDAVLLVQTSRRGTHSLFFSRRPSRILQEYSRVVVQAWTLRIRH
jgi:hypothetical protein